MTEPHDDVAAGRAAWERIKSLSKPLFEDWMAIGRALIVGRAACMAAAKSNGPHGGPYNRLIRLWLDDNGLGDIDSHERTNAIHMIEHEVEIKVWRDGLSDVARRRANHPHTIIAHWRANSSPQKAGPKPEKRPYNGGASHTRTHAMGRPVQWPQDVIRRAATALREAKSNDLFVVARAALDAAIRGEGDLAELHSEPKKREIVHTEELAGVA